MIWFRFYSEALDDPKVQRLPGDLFKAWVNILCLANMQEERGTLPGVEDIAFRLRCDDQQAEEVLRELARRTLLDRDGDTYRIHGWELRQYNSDTSTDRVRKFRAKQRETQPVTPRNTTETLPKRFGNAIDTESDTDTDTDTDQKQRERVPVRAVTPAPKSRDKRGTPTPDTFPITDDMRAWADATVPDVDIDRETARFLDRNRRDGSTYKDWRAAWRMWMTSPYAKTPARATSRAPDGTVVNGVAMSPRMARNLRVLQETEL